MNASETKSNFEGGSNDNFPKIDKDLGDFIEAAGLLEYDPVTIRKIYTGNPERLIKRVFQTLVPIGLFLLGVAFDKLFGILKDSKKAKLRAKEFSDLLVQLGPAFIKAGQALSTRPDIIPQIVLEELAQLQDQLPGFESDLAMACIEQDLKAPIKKIFKSLDKNPISAASLGQVHQGYLLNGQKVAVKVQRPGLREQITLDLYIVRNIAFWLNQNVSLIRSDLVALIDELGKRVFEEMDYLNEANNAEKFKKLHEHNKSIAVPRIYKEATSRRVLTMEWIDGVKLTDLNAVKKMGINPDEMIDIGVNCSLQQLLEHGFFHADPHPGNLLALPDGRLCYLDFGMMSEVSIESRTGLIQAVVHLVNRSFQKLSKDFVSLGFLAENVNLEPIVPAFEKVFSQALTTGVNSMDFKSVTDDLSGVMYKFPFRVPPYYALIIRSLVTLEGIALSVDPKFKILGAAYPYFAKRLIEDPNPQLRNSLKEMIFEGDILSWERLEGLLLSAGSQKEFNLDSIIDQSLEFIFSAKGFILRKQIVDSSINKIDSIGWEILKSIKYKFKIKKVITKNEMKNFIQIKPIKQIITIAKKIPNLNTNLIIKKLPKIIKEQNARKMSYEVAKGVAEKGLVRLIKYTAGAKS